MYPHQEKLNSLNADKRGYVESSSTTRINAENICVNRRIICVNQRNGFTLIEALVALVVLTIALGPALVLSSKVSSTASVIQNNLIAANLSQEGLEVIRALRDSNWFNGSSFDTGLSDGIFRIEWNSNTLLALGSNPPLKVSAGLYNYSSGTDTLFKRTITITKMNSEELRIISDVTWIEKGNNAQNVKAESHLFDWK